MSNISSTQHLNDDLKFLIACCQTNPSEKDIKFIHTYLSTINHAPSENALQVQLLTSMATCHGILPLVYKTVKKVLQNDPSLPPLINDLKVHYQTIAQINMLMSAELIRIMKLLEDNGIEALAFKGPTLSQMAYGDITLRQYSDLDILVKKEDIYQVDTLLKDQSYQHINKLTPYQEKIWIKQAKDIGLYHPKKNVYVEMHWQLLESPYPMQLDIDAIWQNQQIIKINGKEIRTFSTEDLLLFLCIHGSKHLYERIEWIKDIDLLVQSQNINWKNIDKKVSESGFETMYYLGLYLAFTLFKTKLPTSISEHIDREKKFTTITKYIFHSWQNETPLTIKDTIQRTKIKLKLLPGFKEKISHLHSIILKPSYNELWYIELPKSLYWLYYFIRPYLLLKKYFAKQKIYKD